MAHKPWRFNFKKENPVKSIKIAVFAKIRCPDVEKFIKLVKRIVKINEFGRFLDIRIPFLHKVIKLLSLQIYCGSDFVVTDCMKEYSMHFNVIC